jgi:hypothetical protein
MRRTTGFPMGFALVGAAALGLAGCGGKGEDPGNTLGNLFAYNTANPAPAPSLGKAIDVECPIVLVADSGGAYRIYAGADKSASSVKTQYSLGELSRECGAVDNNLTIRLGISGYVQAGPVGGPGSFSVPIKVTIQRESDKQPAAVKTYRIAATIPPGETQAPFALVTDPIAVPLLTRQADDDYSIYVGFDQGGKPERPQKVARRRR